MRAGAGLRTRIWIACLLGGLAGAGGIVGLFAALSPSNLLFNPMAFGIWPWSSATGCLALAVILGFWLDHGIVVHLRGVGRAIASGDPTGLPALPAARRWGELSMITEQVQSLLARQRDMGLAYFELEELRSRIQGLRLAVELWSRGQSSEPLRPLGGPIGPLVEALNRHRAADEEVDAGGRERALRLHRELRLALADARDSAGQAERGFVETTALLATMRELQRLAGDLQQDLSTEASSSAAAESRASSVAEAHRRYREAAAAAIEELIEASRDSVGHLAAGLARVDEINQNVQVLANRATLIALNVALSRSGQPPDAEGLARDLRNLAAEVRSVTERTAGLSIDIGHDVAAAAQRMQGLRERTAAKLDEAPPVVEAGATEPPPAHPTEATLRSLERVNQLVQDAAAQGERLSAAGERASRGADRLVHRLEEEANVLEDLARRLGASHEDLAEGAGGAAPEPPVGDVRMLGPEDVRPAPDQGDRTEDRR
ncbi:MAG TPA: hypothetical protein VMS88_07095 [Terriglobales bacterium]|nr:hypothetical protein [Terriglobales bacterium]